MIPYISRTNVIAFCPFWSGVEKITACMFSLGRLFVHSKSFGAALHPVTNKSSGLAMLLDPFYDGILKII